MNDLVKAQHADSGSCATYLSCLKSLNESLLGWIEQHVSANPLVILSPIFDDYNRHLAELEQKYHQTKCTHPRYNSLTTKTITASTTEKSAAFSLTTPSSTSSPLSTADMFKVPQSAPQPTVGTTSFAFNSANTNGAPLFNFGSSIKQQQPAESTNAVSKPQDEQTATKLPAFGSGIGFGAAVSTVETSTKPTAPAPAPSVSATFQFGTTNNSTNSFPFAFGSSQSTATTGLSLTAPKPVVTAATTTTTTTTTTSSTATAAAPPLFSFGGASNSVLGSGSNIPTFTFGAGTAATSTGTSTSTTTTVSKPLFTFGAAQNAFTPASSSTSATTTQPTFSFGAGSSLSSAPAFGSSSLFAATTNGAASGQPAAKPLFSFGAAPLASAPFGASAQPADAGASNEDGDDEPEEPPKVEKVQHQEDGSVYTAENVRLYYRNNEGKYAARGAGSLYLKPVQADGDSGGSASRVQLIVRANNALGTVFLSVLLSPSMQFQKQSDRNSVMFVCIPNPPIPQLTAGKPTVILVRTDSAQSCDALFTQLETHAKSK